MENPVQTQQTQENMRQPAQATQETWMENNAASDNSTRELGFQETSQQWQAQQQPQRRDAMGRDSRDSREARDSRAQRGGRDEGTIFVGKKPLMTYVLAVVTQFNAGAASVKIKARGKAISRVIDVTQVVKNRFVQSMRIANFEAATEMLPNEDGTTSKVSSLTLTLTK